MVFQSKVVFRTALGGATREFLSPLFLDFEASWLPRCFQVGGQDGAQIDKKTMPKNDEFLKASWKPKISKILRFWRPTWGQVGIQIGTNIDLVSKIAQRCADTIKPMKFHDFLGSESQLAASKSIENRCKKRCRNRIG